MRTFLTLIGGTALVLLFFGLAFAEASGAVPATVPAADPLIGYLLGVGPYGALLAGAYLLGKGVRVAVVVELSDPDRALLRDLATRRD